MARVNGTTGDDYFLATNQDEDFLDFGGVDTVDYSLSTAGVEIHLSPLAGTPIPGVGGLATGDTFFGIENVIGSDLNDRLFGSSAANELYGLNGADLLDGGAEDDLLDGGRNDDTVLGGSGDDTVIGGEGKDTLNGGTQNDLLVGGSGNDTISGGFGIDTADFSSASGGVSVSLFDGAKALYTHGEVDTIFGIENAIGTIFRDFISGNSVDNRISGAGGNDTLRGFGGRDFLNGGSGDDILEGGAEADTLYGGSNDDFLVGGAGADRLYGSTGVNTASYLDSNAGVNVNLATRSGSGGHAEDDFLSGIQNVEGSFRFDDTLVGNNRNNTLTGFSGNDTLRGGGLDDRLEAGGGNDVLNGGTGEDTFVFDVTGNEFGNINMGHDVIEDFNGSDDDHILFDGDLPLSALNLDQDGNDVVMTLDGVTGSVTVLNTRVSDFEAFLV